MSRPRTRPMSPEEKDRHERFQDALRWKRTSITAFCKRHGFNQETLWRWVRDGDPASPPRNGGKETSSSTIAEAFGIDASYLRQNGPRLFVQSPIPFRAEEKAG